MLLLDVQVLVICFCGCRLFFCPGWLLVTIIVSCDGNMYGLFFLHWMLLGFEHHLADVRTLRKVISMF